MKSLIFLIGIIFYLFAKPAFSFQEQVYDPDERKFILMLLAAFITFIVWIVSMLIVAVIRFITGEKHEDKEFSIRINPSSTFNNIALD